MAKVSTIETSLHQSTHQLSTERSISVQREGLLTAIRWEEPLLVQLESCNSCGTNSGSGSK